MSNRKSTAEFTMVRRSLWRSPRFRGLPADAHRLLFVYFLTSEHVSPAGCLRIPDDYILSDLSMTGSNWTADALREARSVLITAGMVDHDPATQETLLARWWANNPPSNAKWQLGARRHCSEIESERLRAAALRALSEAIAEHVARVAAEAEALQGTPTETPGGARSSGGAKTVSEALMNRLAAQGR